MAATYDWQKTRVSRLAEVREELIAKANGDVLEVGGGTGANLAYDELTNIRSLMLTEPDPSMLRRLERKVAAGNLEAKALPRSGRKPAIRGRQVRHRGLDAGALWVDDQPHATKEIRRVLRPDRRLTFVEHVRSADPDWARSEDHMNWLNRIIVDCECNRPTLETLSHSGFDVATVRDWHMPKVPKFVQPAVIGVATPRP